MAKNNQFKGYSDTWLPNAALESKRWIIIAKTSLFFAFPLSLLSGAYLALTHNTSAGILLIAFSALSVLLIFLNDALLIKNINSGKFGAAGLHLRIYCLLGLLCLVFPGILYIISYMRLKDMFKPITQHYPSGYTRTLKTYPSQPAEAEDSSIITKDK